MGAVTELARLLVAAENPVLVAEQHDQFDGRTVARDPLGCQRVEEIVGTRLAADGLMTHSRDTQICNRAHRKLPSVPT